jgi:hypothetical protein
MHPAPSSPAARQPRPERLLAATYLAVAAAPWLFIAGLAAWAWRAAGVLGHWPVPLADDPQSIAVGDQLYDRLGRLSDALGYWLLLSPLILPVFVLMTWRGYRRRTSAAIIAVYVIGLIMIRLDPFGLLAWAFD